MAERTYQGHTYSQSAPGQPWVLVGPASSSGPTPVTIGTPNTTRTAQAQATLQRTQQEIDQAQATAAANTARTKAEATSAEVAAKTAQEAYAAAHPQGTGSTVMGPDFLKTLTEPDQELVKALADGRLAFPGGFALKAPWWQQKLEQVAQYDPSFDATNYNNRAKARGALLTGKLGTSSNALNTAIGHLGHFAGQLDGTASHGPWSVAGIPIPGATTVNAVENAALRSSGQSGITNFQDTANKLADELESAYRNGGGTEQGIGRQLRSLDANASGDQKRGVIANAIELLASKQAANLYQYNLGSGGKPPVDLLDPAARAVLDQYPDIRDKYFAPPPGPLSHDAAALITAHGGTPPPASGGAPDNGGGPPSLGGGGPGGVSPLDSGGGGPDTTAATGATKNVFDPETAAGLNALVQRGRPYNEAAAYAQSRGFPPPAPGDYAKALGWQKNNPHTPYNASNPQRTEPTTAIERAASSPVGSYFGGAADSLTAGYSDELAGLGSAATGGDYTQSRDAFNANKNIMAEQNPTANLAGNATGGVLAALLGGAAINRFAPEAASGVVKFLAPKVAAEATPEAISAAEATGESRAALLGDAGYGAAYGSGENNQNRLGGAVTNALLAPVVGAGARAVTRGVANAISPPAGEFGPAYNAGVFPSVGQRFSGSGIVGRALNTGEQALQSVPLLGAMVSRARQIPRDAYQTGAFDQALSEIGQQLPPGTGPGTDAHAFTSKAFTAAYDKARSGMQFLPDEVYQADAAKFAQGLDNGTLDEQQAGQVLQRINTAVNSRLTATGGALPGDAYKAAASDLAETQRQWAKTDPLKANALGDYLTIFDSAARRNSDPAAVAMLDQADKGYAKLVRIQNASARGGVGKEDGTFTPNNLISAVKQEGGGVRSGPFLRGDALMQDYANAGRGLSDTLPNSGTADRLLTAKGLGMEAAGASAGGYAALNAPAALAVFAPYVPGVNKAVTRLIAPRSATLPPDVAAVLANTAGKIDDWSLPIGQMSVAAALANSQ